MIDLLVLVADSNMKGLMEGLLSRFHIVEGIPAFTFTIVAHPQQDSGVRKQAMDFVRPNLNTHKFLLVMLDHEGSGFDKTATDLQNTLQKELEKSGWKDRVCAVAFEPECDVWLWVNRNKMQELFKPMNNGTPIVDIDAWLTARNYQLNDANKPLRPKEAIEAYLEALKIQRSSSQYKKLAASASYKECVDPAFVRVRQALLSWFKA